MRWSAGRDYGESQFNRATDALRQPGSSFKSYIYALAFMNGYSGRSVVLDGPICIREWCPQNYNRSYSGPVTLSEALARSINTVPVRLAEALGRGRIVELAKQMGIRSELAVTRALPLGVAEVTVLDMTTAYGSFASGGMALDPHAVLEIRNGQGDTLWRRDRDAALPRRVLSAAAATDLNQILNRAVEAGTGRRAILDGIKVAGKTGTTQSYRDAWFVGYTGNYVAGVWFGNDDYSPTRRMTGGSLPAMTWRQIMHYAHQGIELKPMFGVAPGPTPTAPARPAPRDGDAIAGNQRPMMLSRRGIEVLSRLERRMDTAARLMPAPTVPVSAAPAPGPRADITGSTVSR